MTKLALNELLAVIADLYSIRGIKLTLALVQIELPTIAHISAIKPQICLI